MGIRLDVLSCLQRRSTIPTVQSSTTRVLRRAYVARLSVILPFPEHPLSPWSWMPRSKVRQTCLGLLVAAVSLSCAESNVIQVGESDIVSLRVSPDSSDVPIGFVVTMQALPLDETGALISGIEISWQSGNAAVATVDADGNVTGLAVGTAEISASAAGISASGTVAVDLPPEVAVDRDSIGFTIVAGGADPTPDTVMITNVGVFPLV